MAVRAALGSLARQAGTARAHRESAPRAYRRRVSACALAFLLLRAFQAIAPEGLPRIGEATVDLRVLALQCVRRRVSPALLFGLFPALRRTDDGVPGMRPHRRRRRAAGCAAHW